MLIGNREVGNFKTPYIVAEIGSNHRGSVELAKILIDKAKMAGCDCVKFQSWQPRTLMSKSVYDESLDRYALNKYKLHQIKTYCDKVGIDFSCSVFSKGEADFLAGTLNAKYIKIASMDINNYLLLEYVAKKGLPVMLSVGMATEEEVECAVNAIEEAGNKQIILLYCISGYPVSEEEVNLNCIDSLRNFYADYPVGYSDHTSGIAVPLAAVAKGAAVIEKHFCLDKSIAGPDVNVSCEPWEMRNLVDWAKIINLSLGDGIRRLTPAEENNRLVMRRSIVAAKLIPKGKTIEESDLDFKRPGTGLEPGFFISVVGKKATRDIQYDEVIKITDYE